MSLTVRTFEERYWHFTSFFIISRKKKISSFEDEQEFRHYMCGFDLSPAKVIQCCCAIKNNGEHSILLRCRVQWNYHYLANNLWAIAVAYHYISLASSLSLRLSLSFSVHHFHCNCIYGITFLTTEFSAHTANFHYNDNNNCYY